MLLDYLNAIACTVLLVYCFPVAVMMQATHRWGMWLMFVVAVFCLAVQAVDPFSVWIPSVGWPAVVLNLIMAVGLTIWRKEAWLFMRCRLGPPEAPVHPLRRATDAHPLRRVSDMPVRGLSHVEASRVLGGRGGHQ